MHRLPSATFALCLGAVIAVTAAACGSTDGFDENGDRGQNGSSGEDTDGFQTDDDGSGGSKPKTCDAQGCSAAGGKCNGVTCEISENLGKVADADKEKLRKGGTADSAFKWLYPYDKTVFPRGLIPPTFQFAGDGADAFYVHVTFGGMDYEGFFAGSKPARVTLARKVWDAITLTATKASEVKVEVSKLSGGQVTGPVTETWRIAPGSLAGTIYYETYNSKIIGGEPMPSPIGPIAAGVGIMKIEPGAATPTVLKKGCANVCHTASADGSTLVASVELVNPDTSQQNTYNSTSAAYDLKNGAKTLASSKTQTFTFGGLTPDGKYSLSASNYRTSFTDFSTLSSKLYDTRTGQAVSAPGWSVSRPGVPSFSPDGKHVSFINFDKHAGGDTLTTMDFEMSTRTFSNMVDVATHKNENVAWPAFTPDSKWVVYHAGKSPWFETSDANTGDIYGVDLASKKVQRYDALDGYAGSAVYLPENDPKLNFAPTVLPVAVGGYFWVVFTSHRSYGNYLPSKVGKNQYGKLWVAAVDIEGKVGTDPSHPAFYLDGQELAANNLRGFWVLSPCKSNGAECGTGSDCCGGYCRATTGAPVCVPPPDDCSNEYEHCTTSGDCCNASSQCINSHCATVSPN